MSHVMTKPHCGFRTGPIQTELYKHRGWLEAANFGFRKYRTCNIRVAKTKALSSFAGHHEADLHLCFSLWKLLVFS